MLQRLSKFLMNETDGSPGGGSPPPTPADPAAPKPESVAPQPLTLDQVNAAVAKQLETFQNGFFANARKAGLLPKEKTPEPTPTPPKDAPPAGLSMADVEALLERNTVITARATKHGLTDAQVARLKAGTASAPLESFAAEVDSFLADMGLAKSATTQQAAPAQPQPQPSNHQPISDKGAPVPGGVLDWEREFQENPIGMSVAARRAMDAKYGEAKARAMRLEAARHKAEALRVTRSQG